ncbi:peptidoglycan recognition protein family protein [Leptolyngbya sp. AN02str]|uniref:peptidoglycan recognition protein family protein n=1 Tax=Leptolyngbya sp. AN02str TaxID=3423363 RepID=UPI003D3161E0
MRYQVWAFVRSLLIATMTLVAVIVVGSVGSGLLNQPAANAQLSQVSRQIPVFRRPVSPPRSQPSAANQPFMTLSPGRGSYTPAEEYAPADPTNFGDRFITDAFGMPTYQAPIVVIHETVSSANSALNYFRTPHPRDADQRSYHALIRRNGTVVYIVPPERRAFGAGNSVFDGPNGIETVTTNPLFPPSVNNFAYHISLESPTDGRGNQSRHSGYTTVQYQSLAWLIARTGVPQDRITTHRAVDRSGSRRDPRSFDTQRFAAALQDLAA